MTKKRLFTASEIQKFCYCPEQFRQEKLDEKGQLHWPKEPDTHRLEEGIEYHKSYRQKETSAPIVEVFLLIGLGIVIGLLCLALMLNWG